MFSLQDLVEDGVGIVPSSRVLAQNIRRNRLLFLQQLGPICVHGQLIFRFHTRRFDMPDTSLLAKPLSCQAIHHADRLGVALARLLQRCRFAEERPADHRSRTSIAIGQIWSPPSGVAVEKSKHSGSLASASHFGSLRPNSCRIPGASLSVPGSDFLHLFPDDRPRLALRGFSLIEDDAKAIDRRGRNLPVGRMPLCSLSQSVAAKMDNSDFGLRF